MKSNNSVLEIVALIVGIISIPLACYYAIAGIVAGVLGLVLAFRIHKQQRSAIGKAAAVISIIGMVMGICSVILMIAFYMVASHMASL